MVALERNNSCSFCFRRLRFYFFNYPHLWEGGDDAHFLSRKGRRAGRSVHNHHTDWSRYSKDLSSPPFEENATAIRGELCFALPRGSAMGVDISPCQNAFRISIGRKGRYLPSLLRRADARPWVKLSRASPIQRRPQKREAGSNPPTTNHSDKTCPPAVGARRWMGDHHYVVSM